jgi:hypothetical protein
MTTPFSMSIKDWLKNFHHMVQSDPDFIKSKPRMIKQVKFQRTTKIKSILCLI